MKKLLFISLLALSACTPMHTNAPQQAIDRCKFEASRRDGVAWPDEVALCLRGYGYSVE